MKLDGVEILNACNGKLLNSVDLKEIIAVNAKIDSRIINKNSLFVALPGKNVDGSKFVSSAIDKGASVVVVQDFLDEDVLENANKNNCAAILTENATKALQDISFAWRKQLKAKVIAITGSMGKTTTKKLCYDVLSSKYKVTANPGNFNNALGVPLTICSSKKDDDILITEMGMSFPGEIDSYCKFTLPDWGLLTVIGDCHIENLGSRENIAKAKSELINNLNSIDSKLFLNFDDPYTAFIEEYTDIKNKNIDVSYFSYDIKEELKNINFAVFAKNITIDQFGRLSFDVCVKEKDKDVVSQNCKTQLIGEHNVLNILAAIEVGLKFNISLSECIDAISLSKPEVGRQEIIDTDFGYTIINDAYNANPESMKAAIDVLDSISCVGKKIAVLGDMLELGDISKKSHEMIGQVVADSDIDYLYCVGELSKNIGIFAGSKSKDINIKYFENTSSLANEIKKTIKKDDIILFKASHGVGLQYIVDRLKK